MKFTVLRALAAGVLASLAVGLLSVPAGAGNTTLFSSVSGDVVFPFTAPKASTNTPGLIDNMTIGATTPRAGSFTTLTSTSAPSGAGITSLFASPPATGSTAAAAGTFTVLKFNTQLQSGGGLPTIAPGDCGVTTNGAVVAGSTNQSGSITIGAAATTTCKVTFSAALATAPKSCSLTPMNAAAAAQATTVARMGIPTTTDFTITGTALATANYSFVCI